MNPKAFTRLKLNDKLMLLINKGLCVADICYAGYRIKLYTLEDLYIETFMKEDGNITQTSDLFIPNEDRLREYAKVMDISKLPGVEFR